MFTVQEFFTKKIYQITKEELTMPYEHCTNQEIDTGDTTWVLISTILVMGMLPALAFFEAGLLRSKNTLSIITQIIGGFRIELAC